MELKYHYIHCHWAFQMASKQCLSLLKVVISSLLLTGLCDTEKNEGNNVPNISGGGRLEIFWHLNSIIKLIF